MNSTTKISLGLLGGICAGVCLRILMAPDKGSNSRKKISRTASGWAEKVRHLITGNGRMVHKNPAPETAHGTQAIKRHKQ
jgi:hypothetical protein